MTKKQAEAYIKSKQTAKGGFSKESFKSLGVSYPPPKGWKRRLMNSLVTEVLVEVNDTTCEMPSHEERIEELERQLMSAIKRIEDLESEVFGTLN